MTHAIRIHQTGGPDVLRWEEVTVPPPGPGEVKLRQAAVGVNFIDVYQRTGLYAVPAPFIPGQEGAGVVTEVGAGVTSLRVGDRVAYTSLMGAYAEERLAPANRLVPLPPEISDEQAAAMMLKGLTAEYLLRRTYPVRAGQTILFHAAAGGVGLIACQWAKGLGAVVIGTVGSEEKARLARAHGCDHPIVTSRENFAARVREIAPGGVPVVYDSIGKDTFDASLTCLAPRGMMVLFGQSSGKVPPMDPNVLQQRGSVYLTRPTLNHYTATDAELREAAAALFEQVRGGLKINVNQRYPLREAARAHGDLEARRTTGSTVLDAT